MESFRCCMLIYPVKCMKNFKRTVKIGISHVNAAQKRNNGNGLLKVFGLVLDSTFASFINNNCHHTQETIT